MQNGFKAAADTSLYEEMIFFLFSYCLDYKWLEHRPSKEVTTSQFPTAQADVLKLFVLSKTPTIAV